MNIFYIDPNPIRAALQHVDRHICKMPIELAQMLSTAHHTVDGASAPLGIYKPSYVNHPCSVWIRETTGNYAWAYAHFQALLDEYEWRYGRIHATSRIAGALRHPPRGIKLTAFTRPAQAMPDQYRDVDSLVAYRTYYRHGKSHLHKWKDRPTPSWLLTD
jgi:hypothetical protein